MDWDERHQRYIYEHLRRVTGGTCKRLMIFMPPRHGKSELVTVRYAAWRLRQNPRLNVILAGYNQQLANRFSRKIRKVLTDDFALTAGAGADSIGAAGIPPCRHACCRESNGPNNSDPACTEACRSSEVPVRMFPFTSQKPKNSVAEWETAVGGGLRAVGTGGGVTGFGADLVIIDDPVKSRAEAESKKFRDRVWNWFTDDIQTRLEPDGAVILIQTRWHEDDLAGRLIKQAEEEGMEQWKIIDLPALAEDGLTAETQRRRADGDREGTPDRANTGSSKPARETSISDVLSLRLRVSAVKTPGDPLGRAAGAALWPARFDETALHNLKRSLGSYSFAALYQQRPVPAEGGTFKRHWFKHIVPRAPDGLKWFRAYDLAVSTKQTADYTASFRIAFDAGGDMYIDGGFRRRLEFPEQRRYIIGRVTEERDTSHGIELAIHGSAMMQDLKRKATLQGRPIRGVEVRDDKLTRALVWSPLVEEGRVKLVRAAWNDEFIDEACAFPGGAHDDQIDAVSMAVQMAKAASGKLWVF
jgi:predicted phage terminase large subunit-like protein